MAGKRYSREETSKIRALIEEGLTNKEIALRLGRPEAGIRNFRYREGLRGKAENETRALLQERDRLRVEVSEMQRKQTELSKSVESLEKRKENVEAFLNLSEFSLRFKLTDFLTRLRTERPDLFVLSELEQRAMLVASLLKWILS